MKTALITIQIDDVKLSNLEEIEEGINKALESFDRKRITINVSDTFGPPIPIEQ